MSAPSEAWDRSGNDDAHNAARVIQARYRTYRQRRRLRGEAIDATRPQAGESIGTDAVDSQGNSSPRNSTSDQDSRTTAQDKWALFRSIVHDALDDDISESDHDDGNLSLPQTLDLRAQQRREKQEREKYAKHMGLEYWLEMIDKKHRHGSHLRAYHALWQASDTRENFFRWLDEGEGAHIDAPTCSREVLDRDMVKYLSREQRLKYLVKIDSNGRLRWAKNDQRIWTTRDYRDSEEGIVLESSLSPSTTSSQDDSDSSSEASEDEPQASVEIQGAGGFKKRQYIPAAAGFNRLLQSATGKNPWIFVVDTSFRLYIGLKQYGSFQHSSFMHGARIAAAGTIKVKDGQLRKLAPLSGHYRPPTSSFRAFVHSLSDRNVDMSRVNISYSYAIVLGLEGYVKTKKKAQHGVARLERQFDKAVRPKTAQRKAEASKDKSESAQKEREWLERQRAQRHRERLRPTVSHGIDRLVAKGQTCQGLANASNEAGENK